MIRRSTWVVLAVFGILLTATMVWQKNQGNKITETAPPMPTPFPPLIQDVDDILINKLEIQNDQGLAISLIRNKDNRWEFSSAQTASANQGRVEEVLSTLKSLKPLAIIPSTTPLSDLGLNNPYYRIEVKTVGGTSIKIDVGQLTITGSGFYVLLNKKEIVVVNKVSMEEFIKLLTIENLIGLEKQTQTP